uniref:cysteine dioxygenase n=1 Tax=Oryza rufipogon TaxID=4529 RepID=A0A679BCL1_ORYRU|nr:HGWP repeat containing protein-like [Oryza rufipogon]
MPPLLGVHVFTDRLAFAAADWIPIQICIKGIHGFKLISYAPGMDQSEHHHRLASTAADWCFRLHGWPIMPPLLGVYVFTDRLAFAAADWCFRLHGWPIMPPLLGVYVFTDRLAFAAADWCFRLHGWPLCRRCWASTSSPTGLPSPPPTGVSACTAGLLCRRCWASTSSPTGLPSPPPTGVSACTAGLLCRRCWASTSSPTGLPSPPPTGVSACTADLLCRLVGRLRLHRPAASTAADWCFRLHGWPIMLPLLGVYVFTDRPPHPPLTGVTACTAGLL